MAILNHVIKEKDNIEKIRDRIAVILAAGLLSQYELAKEYSPQPGEEFDPEDYKIGAYMENKRPWEIEDLPIVNILILGEKEPEERRGSAIGTQKYLAQFQIDCYARGRHTEGGDDDTDANIRAWFVSRMVRSILMAEENTYLGLRGIVQKRMITARNTIDVEDLPKSAEAVSLCRVVLEVETFESSLQGEFETYDGMSFRIETADGKIMAELKTPPYKEEEE